MKSYYNDKKHAKFGAFIRAVIGLPYVPLDRMFEGVKNLYMLANKLQGKLKTFAIKMINYIEDYWLNGNYPPETWNMFCHDGITTNNHAEGYN